MTLSWGKWTAPAKGAVGEPQVHWYVNEEVKDPADAGFDVVSQADALAVLIGGAAAGANQTRNNATLAIAGEGVPSLLLPVGTSNGKAVNVPKAAVVPKLSAVPPQDAVIVGVIDSGIALAHDRFRRAGGMGTRILSAWQQGGVWRKQGHLPFGHELTQAGIDAALTTATLAGGRVDEAAFNAAIGLSDMANPFAERWLDLSAAHGTHVGDLACGVDPCTTDTAAAAIRDRQPIIAVELPPRGSIGPSGAFLEFYAIWAIWHIVTTADAIWDAHHGAKAGGRGFPIVINLSYGIQSGPKDGTLAIQRYILFLNETLRAPNGRCRVRVVLPVGNDNLERGTAQLALPGDGTPAGIDWIIQPEDRTANYAEVYSPRMAGSGGPGQMHPFSLSITLPDGSQTDLGQGAEGQWCDLTDSRGSKTTVVARVYCTRVGNGIFADATDTAYRLRYTICAAPTWRPTRACAPSGRWRITLAQPGGKAAMLAHLYVQSDQALSPRGSAARLSYFDTPGYRDHDECGRVMDTYMPDMRHATVALADDGCPLMRRGSMNAIAGAAGVLNIAGYRCSDGFGADYSGSGRGDSDRGEVTPEGHVKTDGAATPTAAFASDDGIWHLGRMAAGARSGSVSIMQGTSFANAEATRLVARVLMDWAASADAARPETLPMRPSDLRKWAAAADKGHGYVTKAGQMPEKLGSGRIAVAGDHGRRQRRG